MGLTKDRKTYSAIQTFTPRAGQCNLTAETWKGSLVRCVGDGDITYTWPNGDTETLSCVVGDDYAIPRGGVTVTVVSGIFHIS